MAHGNIWASSLQSTDVKAKWRLGFRDPFSRSFFKAVCSLLIFKLECVNMFVKQTGSLPEGWWYPLRSVDCVRLRGRSRDP